MYSEHIENKSTDRIIDIMDGAQRPPYMVNAYYQTFLRVEHGIEVEPFRSIISVKAYKCRIIPTDKHSDVYVLKGEYKSYDLAFEAGLKEGLRIIKEKSNE